MYFYFASLAHLYVENYLNIKIHLFILVFPISSEECLPTEIWSLEETVKTPHLVIDGVPVGE